MLSHPEAGRLALTVWFMNRREVVGIPALALVVATAASGQANRVRRIAVLTPQPSDEPSSLQREPFEAGLRELGWEPGRDVVVEYLYAQGSIERLRAIAVELSDRKVDLIIARGLAAAEAAKRATDAIPIVLAVTPDPVRAGLVQSLSRPGGNITGLAFQRQGPLEAKQLEILKEGFPTISHVAILGNAIKSEPDADGAMVDQAAAALGLRVAYIEVSTAQELPRKLEAIAETRADALLVRADPQILAPHRGLILSFAHQHRLPAVYPWRFFAEEGGLMSFGPSLEDLHRRSAAFVDLIFRGVHPATIPVELPTKMELVINVRTAKAINLSIHPNLMASVDQFIE